MTLNFAALLYVTKLAFAYAYISRISNSPFVNEDMLSRYERYRRQVEACPEVMTKEQFHIACHISKRKAKELLDNGVVPCEITGNKTWKYRIRKSDVLSYLERVRGVKSF